MSEVNFIAGQPPDAELGGEKTNIQCIRSEAGKGTVLVSQNVPYVGYTLGSEDLVLTKYEIFLLILH